MDGDAAAEAPGELGRDDPKLLEVAVGEPAREPSGNEKCLVLNRNARAFELVDHGADRRPPRVVLGGRDRQRRRLDHDGRPAAAADERLEGLADEGEPKRVPHGRPDVGDRLAGR